MEREFNVSDDLLATTWQRLGNYLLDTIILYAIIIIVMILTAMICTFFGFDGIIAWVDSLDLGWYLLYFSFVVVYYVIFEGFFSRSIAKFITQTIVVNEDGSKPDFGTIFKRTLCRIIPFDALSYLGGRSRGWHDSIPNVYVVKKQAFDHAKGLFYSFEEIGKTQE